jgi:uncharacterized protein (TIGR00251 family)
MKEREFNLHDGKTGSAITVRITPRASRNEISEILTDGTIKIRLTASPGEEQTNKALIAFLSKVLSVNASQVEVVAGSTGVDKLVTITDLDKADVQERILKNIA